MTSAKTILSLVIFFLVLMILFGNVDEIKTKVPWISKVSESSAKYVFGYEKNNFSEMGLTQYAIIIIFLMIWLIIFVTFGDIIENFSSFNPDTAWILAFAFATIGGLLGMIEKLVLTMTKWAAIAGTFAVYLALATAFFAFLAVNFGLTPLMGWIARRKLMKEQIKGEMNAEKVAAGVKNIRKIEESFEND